MILLAIHEGDAAHATCVVFSGAVYVAVDLFNTQQETVVFSVVMLHAGGSGWAISIRHTPRKATISPLEWQAYLALFRAILCRPTLRTHALAVRLIITVTATGYGDEGG